MNKILSLALCLVSVKCLQAQTLFTYGNHAVSKQEFIKAFNKNPSPDAERKKALQEYLNLYTRFKLKVQAAYDEKLNNSDAYKTEADNFKKQLADNLINDEANIGHLTEEAVTRGRKDIRLAQVFIETPPGADTADAFKHIKDAWAQLQAGKDFGEVSAAYSTDAGTQQLKGDMGYITVFTLPYEIENIVYTLKYGGWSQTYHSNIGYHIFKNVSERDAMGKRKISQLLLPVPASSNDKERKATLQKADSIYRLLQAGTAFAQLEAQYSNAKNNGNATEVSVGEYSSDFEQQVFTLQKPGDISKPFTTAYGVHIVKLEEIIPINKNINDPATKAYWQDRVQKDNRLYIAKKNLVNKWLVTTRYKSSLLDKKLLWAYTDSVLKNPAAKAVGNINWRTVLFSFPKQPVTVTDWIKYVELAKQPGSRVASKGYDELMKEFINSSCSDYYREHLADYSEPLRLQVNEFNEANLLFSVMDKHVWGKASEDSVGLAKYYTQHPTKYNWGPSVNALIITTQNKETANALAEKIKNNISDWRNIVNSYGPQVQADSSRYEQEQMPVKKQGGWQPATVTVPELNTVDNSYTFAYIVNVFPQPAPRSFDEARGMVINDYQQLVEDKWIDELKIKYPVKINEDVFKTIK